MAKYDFFFFFLQYILPWLHKVCQVTMFILINFLDLHNAWEICYYLFSIFGVYLFVDSLARYDMLFFSKTTSCWKNSFDIKNIWFNIKTYIYFFIQKKCFYICFIYYLWRTEIQIIQDFKTKYLLIAENYILKM